MSSVETRDFHDAPARSFFAGTVVLNCTIQNRAAVDDEDRRVDTLGRLDRLRENSELSPFPNFLLIFWHSLHIATFHEILRSLNSSI